MIQIVSSKAQVSPQEPKSVAGAWTLLSLTSRAASFLAHAAAVGGWVTPSTSCALYDQRPASDCWPLTTVISAVRVTDF